MAKKKETEKNNANPKFTKEQLIYSKRYINMVDVLAVVLDNDKEYTFDEVDKLVSDFMQIKC